MSQSLAKREASGPSGDPPAKRPRSHHNDDDDDDKLDRFHAWLRSHGVDASTQPASVRPSAGHGGGAGLRATRDIEAGERVVWCSTSLAISFSKALESDVGKALAASDPALADRYLFYAFLAAEKARQESSFWGPWLAVMPAEFDDPLWWDADDDKEALATLEGTNLGRAVPARLQQLREAFERVRRAIPERDLQWKDFLWAHSCYCSRGFPARLVGESGRRNGDNAGAAECDTPGQRKGGERERVGCMLPLLDMSNHRGTQRVTWLTGAGEVSLRTDQPVAAGEEAYNNYGPKPNSELLLRYGFALPDNRADVVAAPVGLAGSSSLDALRHRLLRRAGIRLGELHLERTVLPSPLLRALRVCCASRRELYALPCRAGDLWWTPAGDAVHSEPEPPALLEGVLDFLGHRNEVAALGTLRQLVLGQMNALAYGPAGLAELSAAAAEARSRRAHDRDRARLQDKSCTFRTRCGLLHRVGQREILHSSLALVDAALAQATTDAAPPPPPPQAPPSPTQRSSASADQYVAWLTSVGGRAHPSTGLSHHVLSVTSRVAAGTELLRLPARVLWTAEAASRSPSFSPLLRCVGGLEDDAVLALYLLHERVKGALSAHAPLVASLPSGREPPAPPRVAHLHGQLFPALTQAEPDLFPAAAFTLQLFSWAVQAVRERAIDLFGTLYILPVPAPPLGSAAVSPRAVEFVGGSQLFLVVRHAGAGDLATGSAVVAPMASFDDDDMDDDNEDGDGDENEEDEHLHASWPGVVGAASATVSTAELVREARAVAKVSKHHMQLLGALGLHRGHAFFGDPSADAVPAPLAAAALVLTMPGDRARDMLETLQSADKPVPVPSELTPEARLVLQNAYNNRQ